MGATVTCSKRVGVFQNDDGQTMYVLFESTYEKNCYPHVPHESASTFGDIHAVMARIFAWASNCEGGMLQGKGGWIKPESYIDGWLNALADPVPLSPEQIVDIKIGGGLYSLPKDLEPQIIEAIKFDGEACSILSVGGTISRRIGSKTVCAIMALGIQAWRVDLKCRVDDSIDVRGLQYAPDERKFTGEVPVVASFAALDKSFLTKSGSQWIGIGQDWQAIAKYIEGLAETVIEYPGNARRLIKAYRESLKSAPALRDSAELVFHKSGEAEYDWDEKTLSSVASKLGRALPFAISVGEFMAAIDAAEDRQMLIYEVDRLLMQGLVHIVLPNGEADLSPAEMQAPAPALKAAKPKAGLKLVVGKQTFELVRPAGPRKGWVAKCIESGNLYRLMAKQVTEALHGLAA
ncbi:hypothetical protein [Azonexus hydrophilus]|uniref:Uncharacterized protein n=1 Tax=Azonexus hydrophilus TaxID=418702 RepID=A0ABZ2XL99_9RHOO